MDSSIPRKHQCPCCGYFTLDEVGEYDVCPVCYWEDDPHQRRDPEDSEGANVISLNEARENYIELGASTKDMLPFVREPLAEELENN